MRLVASIGLLVHSPCVPPVRILGVSDGVVVGIIEMNGNHHLAGFVGWNLQVLGELRIGGIGRNTEPTGGILPTCRPDSVNKDLVPLVKDIALTGRIALEISAPAPATIVQLVESLHNEPVTAISELVGYLGPNRLYLSFDSLVHSAVDRRVLDVKPMFIPMILIMMGIDDDIQSLSMRETHDLKNTIQPCLVNLILRSFADKFQPGHGDSDTGESSGLDSLECRRSGQLAAPNRLVRIIVPVKPILVDIMPIVVGIKMVPHIPAQS